MDGGAVTLANDFCFEGNEHAFWLNKAKGLSYKAEVGPDDDFQEMIKADEQGAWLRNGGIQNPMVEKARAGLAMYRFIATGAFQRYGKGAIHGDWWITDNDFYTLKIFAEKHGHALSYAASMLLAIPPNWGDCAHFGRVRLVQTLRAWTGHGKPASSKLTPDHSREDRRKAGASLRIPLRHLEIKQWFIPGGRSILAPIMPLETEIMAAR
ncbi:MAG: hypothetical protein AAF334_01250 [Pseudomonadota bacterium]